MKYFRNTFVFLLSTVLCSFDPKVDADERWLARGVLALILGTILGSGYWYMTANGYYFEINYVGHW